MSKLSSSLMLVVLGVSFLVFGYLAFIKASWFVMLLYTFVELLMVALVANGFDVLKNDKGDDDDGSND